MHELLQTLNRHDDVTRAPDVRESATMFDLHTFSNVHDDVRLHSSCETASTMQDLLKNQTIFNIFENFQLAARGRPSTMVTARMACRVVAACAIASCASDCHEDV